MANVKASERRGQLVAAARAVLSREGISGATLRAVAAEAKVPLGTLHYVFPSKELLITAVIQDVTDEVSAVFRAAETDAVELGVRSPATSRPAARSGWARPIGVTIATPAAATCAA